MKRRLVWIALLLCLVAMTSAQAASVQLNWTNPTKNADGTPLTNLAGIKVYMGTASRTYQTSMNAGMASSAVIDKLTAGQHYFFAVTSYNTAGLESAYSDEVNITLSGGSGDTTPPSVQITDPHNGGTVARNKAYTVAMQSSDDVGVSRVNLYVNGRLECSTGTSPYRCSWKVPAPPRRTYTLQAEAVDVSGNHGASALVEVIAR